MKQAYSKAIFGDMASNPTGVMGYTMRTPNILYYARLEDTTGDLATLRYSVRYEAGDYPPMRQMVGRDGLVSFNLIGSLLDGTSGDSKHTPMRFQGKNSLNVTGLYDYFIDGKLSGIAYGTPLSKPTYSKENKPNPFYHHRKDGFLFRMHFNDDALLRDPVTADPKDIRPDYIEMLVLEGAVNFVGSYCQQLKRGGFDDVIAAMRAKERPCLTKAEFEEAMKKSGE